MGHLPECLHDDQIYGLTGLCICNELRACEQRVEEPWSAIAGRDQYAEGYAAALDAAREAVMRTCGHTKYEGCSPCLHDDATAAIDALREGEK